MRPGSRVREPGLMGVGSGRPCAGRRGRAAAAAAEAPSEAAAAEGARAGGLAPGRGARGPPKPPAGCVQLPFMLSMTDSVVAVTAPLASFSPLAVTQTPAATSVMEPVPVCRTAVLES